MYHSNEKHFIMQHITAFLLCKRVSLAIVVAGYIRTTMLRIIMLYVYVRYIICNDVDCGGL